MRKPELEQLVFNIDADKMADGACIPVDLFIHNFKDGRVISRLTEIWGSALYGLEKAKTDQRGHDCTNKGIGKIKYEHKTLTRRGTAIRKSSNTGIGRTCTEKDVSEFIDDLTAVIFSDISKFPTIKVVLIGSHFLHTWHSAAEDWAISRENGTISYEKFDTVLNETFDIKVINVSSQELTKAVKKWLDESKASTKQKIEKVIEKLSGVDKVLLDKHEGDVKMIEQLKNEALEHHILDDSEFVKRTKKIESLIRHIKGKR